MKPYEEVVVWKITQDSLLYFFLTKPKDEILEPTTHVREEEHFLYFSCTEAQPTLNFLYPLSQISHIKNHFLSHTKLISF